MRATIERIDRYPVEVPFRDVPGRNLDRELPHWRYFEIVEVELDDESVGHGETMLFYSWGETTDEDIERAKGANAAELMWDDSLGPGLQMALFDAVGTALGAPVSALFGERVRDEAPISWWCIEMPAEDLVAEAERAVERGYTNLKFKGRPWFDVREQLAALDEALPEWFEVDVDFNGTLLDAERALPVLEELQTFPQVSHVEGPIPMNDVPGNRRLAEALDVPVVLHYGHPDPPIPFQVHVCDGFVLDGATTRIRDAAATSAMADVPFWLQLVGTGITAAFSLQCGAVYEGATWPAINCHQLYEHDLLAEPIPVEVDLDALERFRCEKPAERPNPPRLIESNWPDGPTIYFAEGDVNFMVEYANEGKMPYFERGVETRLVPDDGSDRWRELHDRAADEPVVEDEPAL